jgi:threonine synthase
MMLSGIRSTRGTAVAVSEGEMLEATDRMARLSGVRGTPEGGASLAAADHLRVSGWIESGETVVLFNTAAAGNYR